MNNPGANAGVKVQESSFVKRGTPFSRNRHKRNDSRFGLAEDALSQLPRESQPKTIVHGKSQWSHSQQMTLPGIGQDPCPPFASRRFTFDRFVVGPSNRFAYYAAWTVANKRGGAYNPLYLYGESGLGKSHLASAIGNHIFQAEPATRVRFVTAEEFLSEMVSSLKKHEMWRFKERYRRQCDILLIDGVHFLSGKQKTQAELSHTLDHLYHSGKQIILTGNVPPHQLSHMTDGLKSRLGCGLVVDIQPPDLETRKRFLHRRAEFEGLVLPENVVDFLASQTRGSIRRLEGLLINLIAKSSLLSRPLELELAQEVIVLLQGKQNHKVTISLIQNAVAGQYQIGVEQLVSRSRRKSVCHPRQVAMYLCRKLTDESLDTIGRAFCRDHASVIHSIAVIERKIREQARVRLEIDFLVEKLEPRENVSF